VTDAARGGVRTRSLSSKSDRVRVPRGHWLTLVGGEGRTGQCDPTPQLLFGNIGSLDCGFLPLDERPSTSKPLLTHMSDMLAMQDSLLKASAKELLRTDLHLSKMEQAKHTENELHSYVLVHYRTGAPPTRLHTFGEVQCKLCPGKTPGTF
jgi:hypothetical protein